MLEFKEMFNTLKQKASVDGKVVGLGILEFTDVDEIGNAEHITWNDNLFCEVVEYVGFYERNKKYKCTIKKIIDKVGNEDFCVILDFYSVICFLIHFMLKLK